jgi:hypothetical protein
MANYTQISNPERDARTQGAADRAAGKERRHLGGELAEYQRQYDESYKKHTNTESEQCK